jgi:hypothetical protein
MASEPFNYTLILQARLRQSRSRTSGDGVASVTTLKINSHYCKLQARSRQSRSRTSSHLLAVLALIVELLLRPHTLVYPQLKASYASIPVPQGLIGAAAGRGASLRPHTLVYPQLKASYTSIPSQFSH